MDSDTLYDETAGDTGATSRTPRSATQRVILAGIGAMASACDTAGDQFDRFVNRGQQVRDELQERSDDVRRQNWRARNRARDYFRGAMDMVLDTFNVPSRTDVDTINVKLNILTRKLDDLQMQGTGGTTGTAGSTTVPPVPVVPEPPVVDEPPLSGDLTT